MIEGFVVSRDHTVFIPRSTRRAEMSCIRVVLPCSKFVSVLIRKLRKLLSVNDMIKNNIRNIYLPINISAFHFLLPGWPRVLKVSTTVHTIREKTSENGKNASTRWRHNFVVSNNSDTSLNNWFISHNFLKMPKYEIRKCPNPREISRVVSCEYLLDWREYFQWS